MGSSNRSLALPVISTVALAVGVSLVVLFVVVFFSSGAGGVGNYSGGTRVRFVNDSSEQVWIGIGGTWAKHRDISTGDEFSIGPRLGDGHVSLSAGETISLSSGYSNLSESNPNRIRYWLYSGGSAHSWRNRRVARGLDGAVEVGAFDFLHYHSDCVIVDAPDGAGLVVTVTEGSPPRPVISESASP